MITDDPNTDLSGSMNVAANNRVARRMRVLKRGTLGFENQFTSLPVIVRDLNETGVKLELLDSIVLPKTFTLHIEVDGLKINCELAWQKSGFAGAKFIGTAVKSKVKRDQLLRSSEESLSNEFLADQATRGRFLFPDKSDSPRPPRRNTDPAGGRSFGKRRFEG